MGKKTLHKFFYQVGKKGTARLNQFKKF